MGLVMMKKGRRERKKEEKREKANKKFKKKKKGKNYIQISYLCVWFVRATVGEDSVLWTS